MSDHEFEKQVQARMDELKMRPTAAVWTNVEKRIRRERRRRRVILWLPTALLLLGTGSYFLFSHNPAGQPGQALTAQSAAAPAPTAPSADTDSLTQSSTIENNTTPATVIPGNHPAIDQTTGQTLTGSNAISGTTDPATRATAIGPQGLRPRSNHRTGGKLSGNRNTKNNSSYRESITEKEQLSTNPPTADRTNGDALAEKTSDTAEDLGVSIGQPAGRQKDPVTTDTAASILQPAAPAPLAASPAAIPASRSKKKAGGWQWGIQAHAGGSHIDKKGLFDLLSKENVIQEDLSANRGGNALNMAPSSQPSLPQTPSQPSSVKTGLSYSAGAFVQKPLTKRFSLSAGLQYTYFSVETEVGSLIRNSRTVNNSLSGSQLVDQYYQGSTPQMVTYWAPTEMHEYTNRYHFIELPVAGHLQLNRGKRLPIIWDLGFSLSRLLNTNALHYDGRNDVYYKENDFFNKMQGSAFSGFNVGLFAGKAHPLWVGPSINYQFSNLLNDDVSNGQHLWSFGLNMKWFIKK